MNRFIKKFASKLLVICCILTNATSCYDKTELEDRDFVLTVAIDKYIPETNEASNDENENIQSRENIIEESLENNTFTVTLTIPDPYAVVNHQDDAEKIISSSSNSITTAVNDINKNSSTSLDFSQTKVVILGKSLLEDEKLFKQTLDALERNKRLGRKVLILATEHNAKDLLDTKVENVNILGYFLSNYYSSNQNANINSTSQGLLSLIQSLEDSQSAVIPLISIYNNEINLSNSLVIKDFKWKEIIYSENLQGYSLLLGDKNTPIFSTTTLDDISIPMRITKRDVNTFITEKDGKLIYNCIIDLEGSVNEFSFNEESLLENNKLKELEEHFNNDIEIDILNTFYFFQDKVSIDGLDIIDELYKNNYKIYEKYKKYDNEYILKQFTPNVVVNTKINSIGTTN